MRTHDQARFQIKLTTALVKASKTCKSMRRLDPANFRKKYGSRPNAFARCVSAQSKQKQHS